MSDFADIRPFNDSEVDTVLQRLLHDREFLSTICQLKFGRPGGWFEWALRPLVRAVLRREMATVTDVSGFQAVVASYMSQMIERTTAGFSIFGLEALEPGGAYLFMSNHRDITLDPAFTSYALYHNGFDTTRVAIGDNLLTKPFVSDLMRLNKSFIVKRSERGPRQILAAYKELSAYIDYSLKQDGVPIWIAQREGRAKDGLDRTEPAIIKMLAMSQDKQNQSFAEYIGSLNIVPVAMSYELDPCDALKAAELQCVAEKGSYEKAEHEDVASIAAGIAGNKGHVHVVFGSPLGDHFETPDAVAAEIDRQIIANYSLHATNVQAFQMLHGKEVRLPGVTVVPGSCSAEAFEQRIQALPEAEREYALAMYANAVVSKLELTNPEGPASVLDSRK